MKNPATQNESSTEAKLSAVSKPHARTLRTGPTAKDLDRFVRSKGIAERRGARIARLLHEVAQIAAQFEPVDDELTPIGADAIEKQLWGALTELTGIRPANAAGREK